MLQVLNYQKSGIGRLEDMTRKQSQSRNTRVQTSPEASLSLSHNGKKAFEKFLDPDHSQNPITCSLYHPGPLHEISSQSVHNVLSNFVNRQTNSQTNATESITSLAEVKIESLSCCVFDDSQSTNSSHIEFIEQKRSLKGGELNHAQSCQSYSNRGGR